VRNLPSIDGFRVFKTSGMLGNDHKPPYEYVEMIDVNNMDTFSQDVGTQTMQQVAAEFQSFADNPMFILSDDLE
ncbi:MAG: REDY-like protein HapK, partial [Pseudomonadota bacterium]